MRHASIDPQLFIGNRAGLRQLMLPNALAIVNANDVPTTNADGTLRSVPNSDLFYLTGVEQEESILLLFPDADDEKLTPLLMLRYKNAISDAVADLGPAGQIRKMFVGFQRYLYE